MPPIFAKGIFAFTQYSSPSGDSTYHNVVLPSNRPTYLPLPISIQTGRDIRFGTETAADVHGKVSIDFNRNITIRALSRDVDPLPGVSTAGRRLPRFALIGTLHGIKFSNPRTFVASLQLGPSTWENVGIVACVDAIESWESWLREHITVVASAVYSYVDPLSRLPYFEAMSLDLMASHALPMTTERTTWRGAWREDTGMVVTDLSPTRSLTGALDGLTTVTAPEPGRNDALHSFIGRAAPATSPLIRVRSGNSESVENM